MKENNRFRNLSFIWIILALIVFWPLGIFLLLLKFGIFDRIMDKVLPSRKKEQSLDREQMERLQKYKIIIGDSGTESIEYLAGAVGISVESALRDLQMLVADNQFGPDAYINYLDKTLVLGNNAGKTAKEQTNGTAGRAKAKKPETEGFAYTEAGKRKKFKPFGSLPTWLAVIGWVLLICGIILTADSVDDLVWYGLGFGVLSKTIEGVFLLAGGVVSLLSRNSLKSRTGRMMSYMTAAAGRDYIQLEVLRSVSSASSRTLHRDLEVLINGGYLGSSAFIDMGSNLLILKAGAKPEADTGRETEKQDDNEDRYRAILQEIRQVNNEIPDPVLTERITEIENLTAKIFDAVREKPDKMPQIKSFMSYYLPTMLKLLHSYADLDRTGTEGKNVRTAKKEIERILDMLVEGFEKQLDKLYESDAMDISTDINVLENMLRKDGLSDDGSGFGKNK